MNGLIRLRGLTGTIKGRTWEYTGLLRVGRHESSELRIDDASVSRQHAEMAPTERGWRIRDLGSTNGTYLNGTRLGTGQWPLRVRDLVEVGEFTFVVDALHDRLGEDGGLGNQLRVEATSRVSFDEALQALAFDRERGPRPGEQLQALLRASHHLGQARSEDELLRSILDDAVRVLDAQRGAIALAEGPDESLRLRAVVTGPDSARKGAREESMGRPSFSQHLAQRCFSRGESILCHNAAADPELAIAQSIAQGEMDSALCVLLRTPRKRLGILHLDRGPWQERFTVHDLDLADALAASVSAGIESAQLLRKQRDLFLSTITILSQAVELRDEYTGGHTARVTKFSLMLAEQLRLSSADVELIRIGTPLHDIGKIGIDDAILRKPDRLTPEEFAIMKLHTVKGDEILATIPELRSVRPIVRSHHERWDGRGYPDNLEGEQIPLLARIVAVADTFDAMTSDRPYRKGMEPEVAFGEVALQSGKQFDPACAEGFLAIEERIRREVLSLGGQAKPMRVTKVVRS